MLIFVKVKFFLKPTHGDSFKPSNENHKAAIDCGMLWQQFESEKWFDRIPDKLERNIYAVYYKYDGDHTKPFSLFIGSF